MKVITRKKAASRGLRHYFTGKPCGRDHLEYRNVKTRTCLGCARILAKTYIANNPAAHTAKLVSCRAWRKANPDKVISKNRKYRNDPRGYLIMKYCGMKSRVNGKFAGPRRDYLAKLYKGLGIMPKDQFLSWAINDINFKRLWPAFQAAGRPQALAPAIDRIDTQRGYVIGNVQFLTHSENTIKSCLWRHHGINQITKAA